MILVTEGGLPFPAHHYLYPPAFPVKAPAQMGDSATELGSSGPGGVPRPKKNPGCSVRAIRDFLCFRALTFSALFGDFGRLFTACCIAVAAFHACFGSGFLFRYASIFTFYGSGRRGFTHASLAAMYTSCGHGGRSAGVHHC